MWLCPLNIFLPFSQFLVMSVGGMPELLAIPLSSALYPLPVVLCLLAHSRQGCYSEGAAQFLVGLKHTLEVPPILTLCLPQTVRVFLPPGPEGSSSGQPSNDHSDSHSHVYNLKLKRQGLLGGLYVIGPFSQRRLWSPSLAFSSLNYL